MGDLRAVVVGWQIIPSQHRKIDLDEASNLDEMSAILSSFQGNTIPTIDKLNLVSVTETVTRSRNVEFCCFD
jgi:hypothetical protein